MKQYHIAGAAVAVVKDGKLFFTKGYGYKDIEHGIPVDPEETMFRIGSNTKPFTWTTVMQLAEQGKVDLDAMVTSRYGLPETEEALQASGKDPANVKPMVIPNGT